MINIYRLKSNSFAREEESEKINPYKTIFLSMEGTNTEKEYFNGFNKYKNEFGYSPNIVIEPLSRRKKDGSSAPKLVIELLEEYLNLRNEGVYSEIKKILNEDYNDKIISDYIYNTKNLDINIVKEIDLKLEKIGYDLQYRKSLASIQNSDDIFGIVIDKDNWHNLDEIISYCKLKNYKIYISNPCFELWLLFHWLDVSICSTEEQEQILLNKVVSDKHTYISKKLSELAHHGKSGIGFKTKYLPKIDIAISNSKKFSTNVDDLKTHLGTNMSDLIILLKNG